MERDMDSREQDRGEGSDFSKFKCPRELPQLDAKAAAAILIDKLGINSGVLGEPDIEELDTLTMGAVVNRLDPEGRAGLRRMAESRELGDVHGDHQILPENFERELINIIDRLDF